MWCLHPGNRSRIGEHRLDDANSCGFEGGRRSGRRVDEMHGFGLVGSVESGEEALDTLQRLDPDLVLLDVRMPGLNGPQTCSMIRERGTRSVVVLVSAHPRPELPDSVDTCGADAVLYKGDVSPRRLEALWQSVQLQRSS